MREVLQFKRRLHAKHLVEKHADLCSIERLAQAPAGTVFAGFFLHLSIRRAGADFVLTYAAREVAELLQ